MTISGTSQNTDALTTPTSGPGRRPTASARRRSLSTSISKRAGSSSRKLRVESKRARCRQSNMSTVRLSRRKASSENVSWSMSTPSTMTCAPLEATKFHLVRDGREELL